MSRAAERDPNGKDPHQPGAKLDEGKVMAGVLDDFALALMAVAEVGTFGANKYTRGGWQSVPNGKQRYRDALWRHHLKERHEPKDPETGLLHKAHKAWNALAELELELRGEQQLENPEGRPGEEKPDVIGKASIAFGPNSYWVQCAGCDKKFYDIAPLHSRCKECAPDSYAGNPHHHQIAVEPLPPAPAPIAESEESTGAGATLEQSFRWPVRMGSDGYRFQCPTCGVRWHDPREFTHCRCCGEQRIRGVWNG